MTDLRGHVAELAHRNNLSHATLERLADEVGVPKGERADESQLAAILARLHGWAIESPGSGVPTASPATTPSLESSESTTATADSGGAVSPSLPSGPALDPQALLESAQAIVGGELVDVVPPELQERIERARAKGKAKPDDEDEVEQIRAGLAS
jgi:hypothetical protein